METKHTPEPWELSPEEWSIQIISGEDHVLEVISSESFEHEYANAERIVACVNACAGFTNEELETLGHFKAMHETIVAENEKLRKDKEELLAALERVRKFAPMFAMNHKIAEVADAAIAKAKGGSNG